MRKRRDERVTPTSSTSSTSSFIFVLLQKEACGLPALENKEGKRRPYNGTLQQALQVPKALVAVQLCDRGRPRGRRGGSCRRGGGSAVIGSGGGGGQGGGVA